MKAFFATFILLFLMSIGHTSLYAQDNINKTKESYSEKEMSEIRDQWNSSLGSFQIQIVNSRRNPQINVLLILEIEKNRKEDDISYLQLEDDIRVMILPKSTIQKEYTHLKTFEYINE